MEAYLFLLLSLLIRVSFMEGQASLLLLLLSLLLSSSTSIIILTGNQTDHLALISFKEGLTQDPNGILSSWNQSMHHCQWPGVICSTNKQYPQRVTSLDLSSHNLTGSISPSIANLTFLTTLFLMENNFHGEIPPSIGHLQKLQYLNLSYNSMQGVIPATLSNCTNLRLIDLNNNQLVGSIPSELGSLSKLDTFGLFTNKLTGFIPASLGNLSSLRLISLSANKLQGRIPEELGGLRKLIFFNIGQNMFSGSLPSSLFNLSSLRYLYLSNNQFEGELPSSMCTSLPKLEQLFLTKNHFTGALPSSLPNATGLYFIDSVGTNFRGRVPPDLGNAQGLMYMNLNLNYLDADGADGWQFLTSLANCSNLVYLYLAANEFAGVLPNSIANLSTKLEHLQIQRNHLSGRIPEGIGNLVGLTGLAMHENQLSGPIPASIGKLHNLQYLLLHGNGLVGNIPSSIGNLTKLLKLGLESNHLEGPIPSSIANLQQLITLDLSKNGLNGAIPKEIASISSLADVLNLANNSLVGSIPLELGQLTNLGAMYFSGNKLSGEIPATLGGCQVLEYLYLDDNGFHGTVPAALGNIRGLRQLDLSHNNLTGPIPEFLANFKALEVLSLSFNHFTGNVPVKGAFQNASVISVIGNRELCGGIPELHLPKCKAAGGGISSSSKRNHVVIVIASILGFLSIILLFSFGYLCYRRKKSSKPPPPVSSLEDQYPRISYTELAKATNGFSSENLVGMGRYGSVYRGSLDNGNTFVAVKVFKLEETGASKSFIAECEALRNIRHRNLIKIITCCSSVDSQGNDFKALVFDFMPNGSLETRLHGGEEAVNNNITLLQRLNIVTDIADALEYLHHCCQPPIVHCDLKPSNILLDDEMAGRVGDFGLARLLPEAMSRPLQDSSGSIGIRGSIGYVAPEYGGGAEVNTAGDVYSYGVLLLEMFTGKRPVSDVFKDGLTLCGFVEMALNGRVMEIVDPPLLSEQELGGDNARRFHECLTSVFKLGLSCSNPSPRERMSMQDVAVEIRAIRHVYSGVRRGRRQGQ